MFARKQLPIAAVFFPSHFDFRGTASRSTSYACDVSHAHAMLHANIFGNIELYGAADSLVRIQWLVYLIAWIVLRFV